MKNPPLDAPATEEVGLTGRGQHWCMKHTLVKVINDKASAHPLRCKCWTCDKCRPWRKAQVVKLARDGQPNTFITLTSNPAFGRDANHRAQLLVDGWRLIVRYARRTLKMRNIAYMAVIERTEKGEPHLHIIARMGFLPQKKLSALMRQHMNAPIVDIRKVRGNRAITNYITKYVGKDPAVYQGCKRYWTSRNWTHPTAAERRNNREAGTYYFSAQMNFQAYNKLIYASGCAVLKEWPSTTHFEGFDHLHGPPGCPPAALKTTAAV